MSQERVRIPENVFAPAVKRYWEILEEQGTSAKGAGRRKNVTGGKQMAEFENTISRLLVEAGIDKENIFKGSSQTLPGYFRPTKRWDLIIVKDNFLIGAIELKSQSKTSIGNWAFSRSKCSTL